MYMRAWPVAFDLGNPLLWFSPDLLLSFEVRFSADPLMPASFIISSRRFLSQSSREHGVTSSPVLVGSQVVAFRESSLAFSRLSNQFQHSSHLSASLIFAIDPEHRLVLNDGATQYDYSIS
jgi:hypothetical protein